MESRMGRIAICGSPSTAHRFFPCDSPLPTKPCPTLLLLALPCFCSYTIGSPGESSCRQGGPINLLEHYHLFQRQAKDPLPVQHFSHLRKQRRHRQGLSEKVDVLAVDAFVDHDIPRVAAHEERFDRGVDSDKLVEDLFAVSPRHHDVEDDE